MRKIYFDLIGIMLLVLFCLLVLPNSSVIAAWDCDEITIKYDSIEYSNPSCGSCHIATINLSNPPNAITNGNITIKYDITELTYFNYSITDCLPDTPSFSIDDSVPGVLEISLNGSSIPAGSTGCLCELSFIKLNSGSDIWIDENGLGGDLQGWCETPTLCHVNISPESSIVYLEETEQFSANSFYCDSYPCYSWEIMDRGSTGSTISDDGLYTAGSGTGTDTIKVTDTCNGDISDTAVVNVVPCKVQITPILKSVFPNESIQFSASASGDCVPSCYTWDIMDMGSTGSTIDANGLYTAGSGTGTDTIKVTDSCNGGISDTATVTVGNCKVTINPSPASVFTREELQFAATVDAYMGATCNDPCYTWDIMDRGSTESTISANGLYTAGGTLGTEIVTVTDTCNNISDTALVNVTSTPTTTTTTSTPPDEGGGDPDPGPDPDPPCTSDDGCDDGLFCNGSEICSSGSCWAGSEPCPDDELFCNGEESCDEDDDVCTQSGDPCAPDFTCDEDSDLCIGCSTDADCNDGVFCNGVETCQDEVCQSGSDPCSDDELFCNGEESCDEETDACLSAGNPCAPGEECDEGDDVCVPPSPLPLSFNLIPDSAARSHVIPLPLFMFIASDDPDTKFASTATAGFSGDDIIAPLWSLLLSEDLIFTFSLINPAGLEATGSIAVEVTVTTDEGEGTATLNLNMLPSILDEER